MYNVGEQGSHRELSHLLLRNCLGPTHRRCGMIAFASLVLFSFYLFPLLFHSLFIFIFLNLDPPFFPLLFFLFPSVSLGAGVRGRNK